MSSSVSSRWLLVGVVVMAIAFVVMHFGSGAFEALKRMHGH